VHYWLSRRGLVLGGVSLFAIASSAVARDVLDYLDPWDPDSGQTNDTDDDPQDGDIDPQYGTEVDEDQGLDDEQYYDPALLPPPESEIDYPIEAVDPSLIESIYHRQEVSFDGYEAPGTVVVDPKAHFLYFVSSEQEAIRYGVGVGRAGFAWSGDAEIRMKRRWPRWVPPKEMVDRDKRASKWANGQPGGPKNPLGARALYLFSGGKDTLYRIHGTNDPKSIGKSVSSGCVRLLNEDIADLFNMVKIGTKVVVRA